MKKRIGFIAMSGIRAQDAELLELGLTLPGFVERSKVIASLPSLSMLTLAALTPPEQFEVEYHEILDLKSAGPLPGHFDLVALTSLSAQILEAYAVADHFAEMGIPVVMGGSARHGDAGRGGAARGGGGDRRGRGGVAGGAGRLPGRRAQAALLRARARVRPAQRAGAALRPAGPG
ncbi:MAG: hypothetical protein U1F87_10680 [Kiritimatiellia bacterium]